jgi:polar amino acid transport system substrate-binding protein
MKVVDPCSTLSANLNNQEAKMKKKIFSALVLVVIFCLVGTIFTSTVSAQENPVKKKLIASGHPTYPPVMWRENDKIIGAGADIVNIILTQIGIPFEIKYTGDWAQVQKNAKDGKIDVIVAAYKTDERSTYMDYSIPYMKDSVMIFVKKGNSFPFKSWNDLVGKTGTTNISESYGQEMDEIINTKLDVKRVPIKKGFQMLIDGKSDYMIIGEYSGLSEAKSLGFFDDVEYLPNPFTVEDFYVAFSKKSKYLGYLPAFNEKLKELIDNGTVDKKIQEYQQYWDSKIGEGK